MDVDFQEQAFEPEIAAELTRHEQCDYQPGEETAFWRDFASKLRDALTPYAERLWNDDYVFGSPASQIRNEDCYWLNKAIERAAPVAKAANLDIACLLWLRRYLNGEVPRDMQQVRAVQDLVATLTLAETDKLGKHYWLPELPAEQTGRDMDDQLPPMARQWRSLAERFRRIADHDCSEADVRAAAAHGGRLLYESKAAGLLANIEFPELAGKSKPSDDDSHLLANIWYGIVQFLPGNPSHARWEHRGGPNDITVGSTNKADWRIRAENYAAVCNALADEIAAGIDPSGSAETATKALDRVGGDLHRLLVDLTRSTATLDGKSYDVTSNQALRWIKVLTDHPGEWIASPDLPTYDADLDGVRTDKLRPYLPEAIATLIESSTGKGSRFNQGATDVTRP